MDTPEKDNTQELIYDFATEVVRCLNFEIQREGEKCAEGRHSSVLDDLLSLAKANTEISVAREQGCDIGNAECPHHEFVMVAKSSNITLSSGRIHELLHVKDLENISIRSLRSDKCIQNRCSMLSMADESTLKSVKITLCRYKSNCVGGIFRGLPVVLKFSNSKSFLKCSESGDKAALSLESFEIHRLKQISNTDDEKWPFVFYMTISSDRSFSFESANCSGWFIKATENTVEMGLQMVGDDSCLFLIQS